MNLPRGLKDKKGIEAINARMLKQIPFDKAFLEQRIGKPLNTYSATMENLSGFIQTINTFPTYEANNSLQNIIDCGQQDLPLKNPEIMSYLFSKERGIINQEEDLHSKMQNLQNMYGNPYFEPTKLFTGISQPIFQNGLYKLEGRNKGKELVSENGLYYESQNHGVIKGETGKNENIGVSNANSQVKYENTHELGLVQDSQIKVEEHVSNNVIINHYENIARNKVMLENTKKKIKMV